MAKLPAAVAATSPAPAPVLKPLADGIYIGLSSERYHADDALGSSNLRDLLKGPNLYWHKSNMNPKKPKEKKTPAKILGTATHRLLLDGRQLFEAEYIRGPYGPDDEDLTPAEKSALTKAAKAKLMEGQELLPQEDYDFVVGCKQVLDADPKLTGCLDNGLSEVSVFFTRKDGVRCKVRLDKLKIKGIGDIKTIANERERPLEQACCLDISTYRYDIPAEHYSEGRRQMGPLFEAGKVFIGDEAEPIVPSDPKMLTAGNLKVIDFLRQCIAFKNFGFQLVFIPKKGAPDAWSTVLSQGNPILVGSIDPFVVGARTDIETAIEIYKQAKERYGAQRWLPGHEVEELDIAMLPFNFGRLPTRAR